MSDNLTASVKEALERTEIMALSTIGEDGPWTSPVKFSHNEKLELTFMSMIGTKHVQNILYDPRVSVAIYSWPGLEDGNLGLQIKGRARHESDSANENDWHSFRIIPDEVWCFDSRKKRQREEIDLNNMEV